MDDAQIAELIIHHREHGDRESWTQLYDLAHEKVTEMLLCFHRPQNVEECANEFWLNLRRWTSNFVYDPKHPPLNWLFRGAQYQARQYLDRRESTKDLMVYQYGVLPGGTGIDRGDGGEGEPINEMIRQETAVLVRDAVASIKNPNFRYMAQEYFLEGRTVTEVADEQGIPRGTGWRQVHEARKELRRKLRCCA